MHAESSSYTRCAAQAQEIASTFDQEANALEMAEEFLVKVTVVPVAPVVPAFTWGKRLARAQGTREPNYS